MGTLGRYAFCDVSYLKVGDAGIRVQWSLDESELLLPESLWPIGCDPFWSCIGCADGEP